MLSCDTTYKLKNLLVTVGQGERMAETLRQRLCRIPDFSPHSAFQRIDRDATGNVDAKEIVTYLRDHYNYSATEAEVNQLIKFFDNMNDDGDLNFKE